MKFQHPHIIRKEFKHNSALWKRELREIWGCYCGYCGKVLKKSEVTLDHITPIHLGGRNTRRNMILCCESCNNLKGHKPLNEFLKKLYQL